MNRLVKKLMVVLLSAFMVMGVVTTPVQAKGSSSDANGWGNWWGWWWPVQPKEPEPVEEPVIEEEPVDEEVPEQPTEPVVEETPVVEEEPVYTTDPIYAESANYSVTVSFDETAQIPAGTVAAVTEFAEGSPEYEAAKAAVLAADDDSVVGFAAFDVSLYYNNEEFEPASDVNVSIDLKASNPEADTYEINHLDETSGAVEVETVVSADAEATSADFAVAGFSTFTITWRSGQRTVTVHYVDENGTELPVSNSVIGNLNANSDSPAFLIYDVDGYEYSYTYRNNSSSRIAPYLANGNSRWYYYNQNGGSATELSNGDNIYVVYKAKTAPTTGGTVQPAQEEWPEGDGAPKFSKSSVNNGDGTNTISLSIKAAEAISESSSKANVIVVFDVSGSMDNYLGRQTRLAVAKEAVNKMADQLLAKKDSQGHSLVKMALVSFSTTASVAQALTDNASTYKSAVNALDADGGTNWEQSLQFANQMAVDSDAATFVVFVTDGDPTFRVSRGNVTDRNLDLYTSSNYQYYRSNGIFGAGSSDEEGLNFSFAVEQVKEIIAKNKTFFAIGVSNDVQKVENLTTQGGAPADNAFLAADENKLKEAFDQIANSISSTLGFGDVAINDGITSLTNSEMKVMEEVDPNSFQYYRYGGKENKYGTSYATKTEWTTREEDGCAPASYNKETGAVQWNMGESFQLEDGVTYVVTFRVWPSQAAYDLVADLNNGIRQFSDLTEAESKQVVQVSTNPDKYALKTNTDKVSATYNKTTKTGEVVTVSDETNIDAEYIEGDIQNMDLDSMKLSIKKIFADTLTDAEDRKPEVTLVLKRRVAGTGEYVDYPVPQPDGSTSANIVLNDANNWSFEMFVAPGLMAEGEVLEKGYEFTVTEPGIDYHYELNEEAINPMLVDTVPTYLGDGDANQALTAENMVKGGINITKVLVDNAGNELLTDEEFTIKGKILDENGNPYTWKEGDSVDATGAYHKYDKDGNRIVYKGHFATTADITFTLKPGEAVRFINVPQNCTYEFYEETTGMPAGISFVKVEGENQTKESGDGPFVDLPADQQPTVSGGTISGKVYGNTQHNVTFTNKTENGEYFYVYHSADNTIEKVSTEDSRVTKGAYDAVNKTYAYKFNMVNEVIDDTTTPVSEYLYGGYYTKYNGAALNDDEIMALTYTNGWSKDEKGQAYSYQYIHDEFTHGWNWNEAYTVKGDNADVKANTVYYLKEVPNGYLRPYMHYTYNINTKVVLNMWLISAVDDANYQQTGFIVDIKGREAKIAASLTVKTATNKSTVKLLPENVFRAKGVKKGYITYADAKDLLVANAKYTTKQYWITPDGVEVTGVTTRTINIGNKKYGTGGVSKTDADGLSTVK